MQLTEEQLYAVQTPGSLSVTASAGTGKTTVLTQRFLHCFLERRAELSQIVAFTFTEKASHEMRTRILASEQISYDGSSQLGISTIHAFCRKILLQHGKILGLSENFDMHDEKSFQMWREIKTQQWLKEHLEDSQHVLTRFCQKFGYGNLKKAVSNLFEFNLGFIPENQLKCVEDSQNHDIELLNGFLKSAADFQNTLVNQRITQNWLYYDDLELLTLRLFENHPEILSEIQKKFRHILVDEYQDVSPRQFQIVLKIFNPELNEIFIVGDPKQSIYGFRGTDSRLFAKMTDIIESVGGKSIYLHETFRTPQTIQTRFNGLFSQVFEPKIFQPGTSHQNIPAEIHLAEIPADSENSEETRDAHSFKVATLIKNLVEKDTRSDSIVILGYTRNVLSIYQQALEQQNIPTHSHNPILLLDHPLIQTAWHILNYLGDLETGHFDKISQVGMLRNPVFNFSESFIHILVKARADNIFFEQTIDLFTSQSDKTNWLTLTSFLKKWREWAAKLSVAELFQKIIDDIQPDMHADEMMLCEDFYHLLLSWQKQDLSTLQLARPFLKNLHNQNILTTSSQNNSSGVRLMTLHAAKGLEFDHVFLVPGKHRNNESPLFFFKKDQGFLFKNHDADQEKALKYRLEETENFTLEKSSKTLQEKEELARLVYVALTRVKKNLYIFCDKPTQTLLKALKENPDGISALKSYNDWLYYVFNNFSCSALR